MAKIRILLAITVGKIIWSLCRLFGEGGGTAAPGLAALKIAPDLLFYFSDQFKKGTILITGTNGKTTTARLITHVFKSQKASFVHNRTGSNLARGLTSACLQDSNLLGKINRDFGVFEIDEAVFSQLAPKLNPRIVVILNLFRDQLDRYGEIDKILNNWEKALKKLPKKTKIFLNSDDPAVASLGKKIKQDTVYFGLRDRNISRASLSHASDATSCPDCLQNLIYQYCYISHLGVYHCPRCGPIQPKPDILCQQVKKSSLESTISLILTPQGPLKIHLPTPGLYNLYNLLAGICVLTALKIKLPSIKKSLKGFVSPFGRVEKIPVKQGKFIQLFLVKNPAGFNEVLRTLNRHVQSQSLLIAINDLIADGQDVSWLWDVDFEEIVNQTANVTFSGIRGEDIALRWKYTNGKKHLQIEKNYQKAILKGIEQIKRGETLFILPTYTAMLEIRKTLHQMGLVHETWQD